MKFNFRKISAIAVSALMTGMTLGVAAAANYPEPFVSGGVANVAVVYGTGAGVSSLDLVQAGNIQDSLGTFVTGGTVNIEGGEAFSLDKDANHYNFNDALNAVYATLDGDEMEDFLADGEYDDGDVDETYSQKITPGTKTLSLFGDSDYNNDEPTVGFRWTNDETILTYEWDLDDDVNYTEMVGTDLPILGGEYYVTAASTTQIDILDSANSHVLNEGDSVTIELDETSYTVSVQVYEDGARFTINGALSDKLDDGEIDEIGDDVYVVAKSVDYVSKESGTSQVEFALGKGKIELIDGEEAELNTEDIDGLNVALADGASPSFLDKITITWKSDGESFVSQEDSISLPGFGAISLAFGGLNLPSDSEIISVDNGATLTLNMGNYDLPIAWFDGTNTTATGEEDHLLNITQDSYTYGELGFANATTVWWNGVAIDDSVNTTANTTTVLSAAAINVSVGQRFIVTSIDDDLSNIDTLYYELDSIDIDDTNTWTVKLEDLIGNNDLTFTNTIDDTDDAGDVTVTHAAFGADNVSAFFEFSSTSGTINYNKAVSEKGLIVTLDSDVSDIWASGVGTGTLTFREADKDDDMNEGMPFTATFKTTSNDKLHVSAQNITVVDESSDVDIGYVLSDLASKITFDQSADENDYSIEYYGEEVTADVQVVGGATTISQGSNVLGNILVKDNEVGNVATKNLIVVGGSCINSAAAALVGGAKCGASWTEATGIGTGQFLIKGYADSTITSGFALLVAGYDAEDTVKATTYLTNKVVDTSKAYKGTTTTETAVVID